MSFSPPPSHLHRAKTGRTPTCPIDAEVQRKKINREQKKNNKDASLAEDRPARVMSGVCDEPQKLPLFPLPHPGPSRPLEAT
jgi:hypothetical protein